MKQGAVINRIVMLLMFLAILLYFGGAAWRGLREPYPTVRAYSYAVEDTVEVTGYLVRQEQVLTGSGGIVRVLPAEGEKVAVGTIVAQLYANEEALERSDRLELLQEEVVQLTAAVEAAGEVGQGESGRQVLDTMLRLRAGVESADFTRLESRVSDFKGAVYQHSQRYGNAADLAGAITAAQEEIAALRAQTTSANGVVTVDKSGIFSGQVDGYESVLTAGMLATLTPSAIDALENQPRAIPSGAVGKLITDARWQFVCPMDEADAQRLVVGESIPVRFSRDWAGEVKMTVERVGAPEKGRSAVVLSSNRFLSETTLLRRQRVELIFSSRQGIRVPTQAVRVVDTVTTDADSGEEKTVSQPGVYVKVGVFAEFKPVTILGQGEDYYMVQPLLAPDAQASQAKKALRAGDQIIIAQEKIWDGMVIE